MNKRILTIALLCSISAPALAYQVAPSRDKDNVPISSFNQLYLGIFGGGGVTNDNSFRQRGIALYDATKGGPLIVNAQSIADADAAGLVGMQFGYKAQALPLGAQWSMVPAAEIEAFYLRSTETGGLRNPTNRVPEHLFMDSFPMNTGVILANAVFSFNMPQMNKLHPYIGGGIGTAILSIENATSEQVSPEEAGINHFNSNPNASNWTFTAQAKAGLQYEIADNWRLFAEYRFLYFAPTFYNFGFTQYPTHIPTTNWIVDFASLYSNLGSVGLAYSF